MHIAIAGFHHRTNTFAKKTANIDDFKQGGALPMCKGQAIVSALSHGNHAMSGFLKASKANQWQLLPLLWCHADACGYVESSAYEEIVRDIIFELQSVKHKVDALYLDLAGTMVAENTQDGEGELLHRIRRIMGGDIPIVISVDMHANITREMFKNADVIISAHQSPSMHASDVGMRAAEIIKTIFQKKQKPDKAFTKPSYLIPFSQQTTMVEPVKLLYEKNSKMNEGQRLLAATVAMGFPASDILECGPAICTYAWQRQDAYSALDAIDKIFKEIEPLFTAKLWSPKEAILHAMNVKRENPLILVDTQDNPAAGGSSDAVGVLRELIQHKAKDVIMAYHYDPEHASLAERCGERKDLLLSLGGEHVNEESVEAVFRVEKIRQKPFRIDNNGNVLDLGVVALVRYQGIQLILTSKPAEAKDSKVFAQLGVDLDEKKMIVLKSSIDFRADFKSITENMLFVESPGFNIENPERLPYRYLRKGIRLRPMGKDRS